MPPLDWDALQDKVADARFSLGRQVVYTPPGGAGVTISAVYMRGADLNPDGDEYTHAHAVELNDRFQLRVSEVGAVDIGATIESDGVTYDVRDVDDSHTSETDTTVIVRRRYA